MVKDHNFTNFYGTLPLFRACLAFFWRFVSLFRPDVNKKRVTEILSLHVCSWKLNKNCEHKNHDMKSAQN